MLEFNQEHMGADLSLISEKLEKVKKVGKVTLCGISLSATLLLSGCSHSTTNTETNPNTQTETVQSTTTSSAIIMENGNALIVDVSEAIPLKYWENTTTYNFAERNYVLKTVSGDEIVVDYESLKLVTGENAHEKAETIAQNLISENGHVTCYDEVQNYGMTK